MGFVKVMSAKELKPSSMKDVEVSGKAVLLVNLEGNYYAIGNTCTHMGCMLSDGTLKGETVQCPCHGSVFSVKTGQALQGPAAKPEPAYKVKVEGDQILVSL